MTPDHEHYKLVATKFHSETGETPHAWITLQAGGREQHAEAVGSGPIAVLGTDGAPPAVTVTWILPPITVDFVPHESELVFEEFVVRSAGARDAAGVEFVRRHDIMIDEHNRHAASFARRPDAI